MIITIKDIAKEIGVTPSTVSRALNGEYGVSDKVRDKIMSKAIEMGYKPNAIARSLVTKRTFTLGFIAPDFSNTFFIDIAHAVRDYVAPMGYTVSMSDSDWSAEIEEQQLNNMEERRVDGVIIKSCRNNFNHIKKVGLPTVSLSVVENNKCCCIDTDNKYGGFIATEHLIMCGYKNIAYIGSEMDYTTNCLRLKGYLEALKIYNIEKKSEYIKLGRFNVESGRILSEELINLKNPPDAIFCANDLIALGVWERLNLLGIKIPNDFGIIGFDNMFFASLTGIRLTTLAQNSQYIGTNAAEILMSVIDSVNNGEKHELKIKMTCPQLIIRETTRKIKDYKTEYFF